jgi:hypothetical protein
MKDLFYDGGNFARGPDLKRFIGTPPSTSARDSEFYCRQNHWTSTRWFINYSCTLRIHDDVFMPKVISAAVLKL